MEEGMLNEERLNSGFRKKLAERFQTLAGRVNRADVKDALDRTMGKVEGLLHSGVDWLADLGQQIVLLFNMLREWWNGFYEIPWATVAAATAALLYFLNPLDLIPDFLPGIGFLDDALVIAICFKMVQSDLRRYVRVRSLDPKAYGL